MPPRKKEAKEAVVYELSSKRKAPPFKPQRPTKAPRDASASSPARTFARSTSMAAVTTSKARKPAPLQIVDDDEDEVEKPAHQSRDGDGVNHIDDDSDEDLADDPLASRPKPAAKRKEAIPMETRPRPPPRRKTPTLAISPMSVSSDAASTPPPPADPQLASASALPPEPSQPSDDIPSIPQPLLVRILHERFQDQATQIDKHAIQVLQKYFEVFVREAIARAALAKREKAARGEVEAEDRAWLELPDLEGVAGGMSLDF